MSTTMPLQYNISNWHQLVMCQSNTSRDLKISVTDFVLNFQLSGIRISVNHKTLGTLFSYVINATGNIVSDVSDSELSTKQILHELAKYGFYVTYEPKCSLSGDQLQYLMTLKGLHFDKLRVLKVKHIGTDVIAFTTHIVVFNIREHPNWIRNDYTASDTEFISALTHGTAIDITSISDTKKYRWDWLDYVASIDDILADNA